MQKKITSREFVDMVISILFHSKKYLIAVKDNNNKLCLIRNPLISEFLNPKQDRNYLTAKIADTLLLWFSYYLYPANRSEKDDLSAKTLEREIDFDFQFRTILFLHTLAPVDLSFLCANKDTEKTLAEEWCGQLTEIMHDLFYAFIEKSQLSSAEISKIIFKTISGETYLVRSHSVEIERNTWIAYQFAIEQYYKILEAKYDIPAFYIIRDFNIPDTEIVDELRKKRQDAYAKFSSALETLKDLPQNKYIFTDTALRRYMTSGFMWLAYCHCPEIILKSYAAAEQMIQNYKAEWNTVKNGNNISALKELDNMAYLFAEAKKLLRIQIKLYNQCGEIGCRYSKFHELRIQTPKEFVSNMVLFLFNGIVSKVGSAEYHKDGNDFYYSEKGSAVIQKYLSDDTGSVKWSSRKTENLLNRVKYYLYPEKRVSGKETISPIQFMNQLWQLYVYTVGIDFSMLMSDADDAEIECRRKKDDWCALIEMTLKSFTAEDNSISELRTLLNQERSKLTGKYQKSGNPKFTGEVLEEIMHFDIAASHYYDESIAQFRSVQLAGIEAGDLAFIRNQRLTDNLILLLHHTISIVESLFDSKTIEMFMKRQNTDHITHSSDKLFFYKNWKDSIHGCWCDDNLNTICMTDEHLALFLYSLCSCCIADYLYDYKLNISVWCDTIASCFKRLHQLRQTKQNDKQHEKENQEYLNADRFKHLYTVIKSANDYLTYHQWMRNQMKWGIGKRNPLKTLVEAIHEKNIKIESYNS